MQAQIVLDSPRQVYTNLDFIQGKVVVKIPHPVNIESIVVKLEGESRTRLMSPGYSDERPKPQEELHKLMYKTTTVFPPEGANTLSAPTPRYHTLTTGVYEYPFEFKIPFNNSCSFFNSSANLNVGGLRLGVMRPPSRHVRTTLPPTLTTFPGLAEIRYYMKVTVNRKEFYKENLRHFYHFNFLPIEPPRPKNVKGETYGRRQHGFARMPEDGPGISEKTKNLFRRGSAADSASTSGDPPRICLDARIPNPAIITCNEQIPLRILVRRLNQSTEQLVLQSLQIELIGHTRVEAHGVFRDETNNWLIFSQSNMATPIQAPQPVSDDPNAEGEQVELDSNMWSGRPLPTTVAPSFETCNLKRSYTLQIRCGIGWGYNSLKNSISLPIQLTVQVFSGIAPPPALLAAMAKNRNQTGMPAKKPLRTGTTPLNTNVFPGAHSPTPFTPASQFGPSSPMTPQYHTSQPQPPLPSQQRPPQPPQPVFAPLPPGEEEPPPSYEDAIGQDLPPLDGPRRNYEPPALPDGERGFDADGKGARRGSH